MSTSNLENNNENSTNNVVNGKNKKLIYGVLFGFVLVIFTLGLMNYQSKKVIDIEKTNNEIQKENYQKELEAHKQKIEEYNKVLTEKEQLEKERFNRSRVKADENTYKELLNALSNSYKGLENSKHELEKAKGFRLLRSAKKKEQQINEAEYEIEIWKRKIELLKLEKLELENSLNQ